mgnify:FL=1
MRIFVIYSLFFALIFKSGKATHELTDEEVNTLILCGKMQADNFNHSAFIDRLFLKYTPINPMEVCQSIAMTGKCTLANGLTYTANQQEILANLPSKFREMVSPVVLRQVNRTIAGNIFSVTYEYVGWEIYKTPRYSFNLKAKLTSDEISKTDIMYWGHYEKQAAAAAAVARTEN